MCEENWRRRFWPTARGGISLPAVGRRTSSSIPPFLGVYPNSYRLGCERVICSLRAEKENIMCKYLLIGAILVINVIFLSGCATTHIVPQPGKITLQAAMEEVATGLNKMYDIRKDYPKSGLMPTEATIVFNISASATDEGKLYIEAGANIDVLKIAKVGAETSSKIEASRGNTVTIKFANILLAPKDTLIMTKTSDDIEKLFKAIEKVGLKPVLIK